MAINQLPVTPETLWLRLLGKGPTQEQAIQDVLALSPTNPGRNNALELLTTWKISLEIIPQPDEEEQKFAMALSQAYLEWKEKTLQQGIQQGIQQGSQQGSQNVRLEMAQTALTMRFGSLDEQLAAIVQPLAQMPPEDYTRLVLQLHALSRETLLARFMAEGIGQKAEGKG